MCVHSNTGESARTPCTCRHMHSKHKHVHSVASIFMKSGWEGGEGGCQWGGVDPFSSTDGTCPLKSRKGQGLECKGHGPITVLVSFSGGTFSPV